MSGRINGEHKEKDLEPWDGGETHNSDSLESLDTDVVRLSHWCRLGDGIHLWTFFVKCYLCSFLS